MSWNIIKEIPRKFADESYYLKAEKNCSEGRILLTISFIPRFMYESRITLKRTVPKRKFFFFKDTKPDELYSCLMFYNDRVEKYGHQIMRMTEDTPLEKLKRMDSLQKDGVLNYMIQEKHNVEFLTNLPEKIK